MVARAIHTDGPFHDRRFVWWMRVAPLSVRASCSDTYEAGAAQPSQGAFHGNGGTILLDEIGESRGLQAKLLRALQEREVYPPATQAGSHGRSVIAATNQTWTWQFTVFSP